MISCYQLYLIFGSAPLCIDFLDVYLSFRSRSRHRFDSDVRYLLNRIDNRPERAHHIQWTIKEPQTMTSSDCMTVHPFPRQRAHSLSTKRKQEKSLGVSSIIIQDKRLSPSLSPTYGTPSQKYSDLVRRAGVNADRWPRQKKDFYPGVRQNPSNSHG